MAQLEVNTNVDWTNLVEELAGEGVKISNVTFNVNKSVNTPIGYFSDGANNFLGMDEGLLMTTGSAKGAEGPNNTAQYSGNVTNMGGDFDADLDLIESSRQGLNDLVTIDFDMQVAGTSVSFNYLFGSEEYLEFIEGEFLYNDVFGFFISGPGINGVQNIAIIDNVPVNIKEINRNVRPEYFVFNGEGSLDQEIQARFPNIQYDGYTTLQKAEANVLPCETYHVKLAIADVRDEIYDSGVFLEKGSVTSISGPNITVEIEDPSLDFAVEGCREGRFIIHRSGGYELIKNQDIDFVLEWSGSADFGIDYDALPGEITLKAGNDTAVIYVNAVKDIFDEGGETVVLKLTQKGCVDIETPFEAQQTMLIRDFLPFHIDASALCIYDDEVVLNENYSGQFPVEWSANELLSCLKCNSPSVQNPGVSSYFAFQIDHNDGCVSYDSVQVLVGNPEPRFRDLRDELYTSRDVFFTNLSTGADSYLWDFGNGEMSRDFEPFISYPGVNEDFYTVRLTAISENPHCEISIAHEVIIDPFLIPNIITPNGDQLNDAFRVLGIKEGFWQLHLYNRWGQQVFESTQYEMDWSATNLGEGVYFYHLENPPGDRKYNGYINVVKN